MPDNEGFENERYTISTLDGELLQTQLKKIILMLLEKSNVSLRVIFLKQQKIQKIQI